MQFRLKSHESDGDFFECLFGSESFNLFFDRGDSTLRVIGRDVPAATHRAIVNSFNAWRLESARFALSAMKGDYSPAVLARSIAGQFLLARTDRNAPQAIVICG